MACRSGCGGRENPKEAPIVGPAVILGNGAVQRFDSDDDLQRWMEWADRKRPGDRRTAVLTGESVP